MSFDRPSLDALDTRIRSDFEANIDAVSLVRDRSPEAGIARALAGASHELHGHLDWQFRQLFADTATGAQLERLASFYGLQRRPGTPDAESDAALQARVLQRMRQPPHGGAGADYVRWALEVPGISQAWVSPGEMGLGTVTLRIAADDADHGPIPTASEVEAVAAHIDNRAGTSGSFEGRPVTAQLFVVAPLAAVEDVVLTISPDTETIRSAIRAELAALYRRSAAPGGIIPRDAISQAISLAPGLTARRLISPLSDAISSTGYLPVLGEVIFQ